MPIAIARLKSSASMSGLSRATLITNTATVRTPATLTRRLEKPRRPTWNAVSAWRSPSPSAILPNAVLMPVATITPRPDPWCTTVPMNAHDERSTVELASRTGATAFAVAIDSPVRTDSSHSRPLDSMTRRSAGTTSPTRSSTTSPGTRSVTSTLAGAPSRQVSAS